MSRQRLRALQRQARMARPAPTPELDALIVTAAANVNLAGPEVVTRAQQAVDELAISRSGSRSGSTAH